MPIMNEVYLKARQPHKEIKVNASRCCTALLISLMWTTAASAKDEGIYVGASLGAATVQHNGPIYDDGRFEIDDSDYAYKILGGYQFSPLFAMEGSYRDMGSVSSRLAETSSRGFDLTAIAGIPLGPLRAFGRIGGTYWESDTHIRQERTGLDDDGFGFIAGVGAEFELGSLGLRAEVEYLDVLDDAWMYSIGMTFTF